MGIFLNGNLIKLEGILVLTTYKKEFAMSKTSFAALLFCVPLSLFAYSGSNGITLPVKESALKNVVSKQYDSNATFLEVSNRLGKRETDYPTNIIRVSGDINQDKLYCDDVFAEIERLFVSKIKSDKFFYNTYVSCTYDKKTYFASKFFINSYFDPLDDQANDYLEQYIKENNGRDVFGAKFEVEKARGVIVSLNIAAGQKSEPLDSTLVRFRQDRSNYFYPSNYALLYELVNDIKARFFSSNPDVILPFLNKWFFPSAEKVYYSVLRKSNYVELQPERIFLMDKKPTVFTSKLHFSYAHNCFKNANKRCL
jgi:hypothetical protein